MSKDFPKIIFLSRKKGLFKHFLLGFLLIFIIIILFFVGVGIFFLKENPKLPKTLSAETESIERQNNYLSEVIEKLKPSITTIDSSYKNYNKLLYLPKRNEKKQSDNSTAIDSLSIRGLVGYSNKLFEFFDEIAQNASTSKGMWKNYPLVFPFTNDVKLVITRPFAESLPDPFTGTLKAHNGIDIATENETKIVAPADGNIALIKENDVFWGKTIKISHANGYETTYAHLGTILVKQGQRVQSGTVIATIGESGWTTSPHLHYELIKNGVHLDPQLYNFASIHD